MSTLRCFDAMSVALTTRPPLFAPSAAISRSWKSNTSPFAWPLGRRKTVVCPLAMSWRQSRPPAGKLRARLLVHSLASLMSVK